MWGVDRLWGCKMGRFLGVILKGWVDCGVDFGGWDLGVRLWGGLRVE